MEPLTIPLLRPQPVGALAWPAGMLVIPVVDGAVEICRELVIGGLPSSWPASLCFVEAALNGDPQRAASLVKGDDAIARYNRAVLVGGDEEWDSLRDVRGPLGALIDTALFSVGLRDEPPEIGDDIDGEIAAVARSARASSFLEHGRFVDAITELDFAATDALTGSSPILAASLRGTRAELLRTELGDPLGAVNDVDLALRDLPTSAPTELRADLALTRALARHELSLENPRHLTAVVADLQDALRTFHEETHPEAFAVCNQHLALAYLAMPMSGQADRIRVGVAVSALRAALRVFTPETHPAAWASTQLNLANSLQYLPSAHQERNLDEAVQIYEELLTIRDPDSDPIGTARILANQANALGHLGVFGPATERLAQARDLFMVGGDSQAAKDVELLMESLLDAQRSASKVVEP